MNYPLPAILSTKTAPAAARYFSVPEYGSMQVFFMPAIKTKSAFSDVFGFGDDTLTQGSQINLLGPWDPSTTERRGTFPVKPFLRIFLIVFAGLFLTAAIFYIFRRRRR